MTPQQLIDLCDAAIPNQLVGEPTIMLKLPLDRPPRGDTIRMFGRTGPVGRLARVDPEGDAYTAVVFFPAVKVRAYVLKMLKTTAA